MTSFAHLLPYFLALFAAISAGPSSKSRLRNSQSGWTTTEEGFLDNKSGINDDFTVPYNNVVSEILLLLNNVQEMEETLQLKRKSADWEHVEESMPDWEAQCAKMMRADTGRRLATEEDGDLNTQTCEEWEELAKALITWMDHLRAARKQIALEVSCALRELIGRLDVLAETAEFQSIARAVHQSIGIVEQNFDSKVSGNRYIRPNYSVDGGTCSTMEAQQTLNLRMGGLKPVVRASAFRPDEQRTVYSTPELISRVVHAHSQVESGNAQAFRARQHFVVQFANRDLLAHLGIQQSVALSRYSKTQMRRKRVEAEDKRQKAAASQPKVDPIEQRFNQASAHYARAKQAYEEAKLKGRPNERQLYKELREATAEYGEAVDEYIEWQRQFL